MEKALDWLKVKGAKKIIVSVAVGNEHAYIFMNSLAFFQEGLYLNRNKQQNASSPLFLKI